MRISSVQRDSQTDDGVAAVMETARSLARALGESAVFKRFEAAQEAFESDGVARAKLRDFQSRQQELRMAAMWGGADWREQEKLEREWETIASVPSLSAYLRAHQELTALLREVAGKVSEELGVDYGAACSPSGGCC